jgi:hypothetical protein
MKPRKEKPQKAKKPKKVNNICTKGIFEYKKLKAISYESLMKEVDDNGCCDKFVKVLKQVIIEYGWDFGKLPFSEVISVVSQNKEWLNFLIENDFISMNVNFSISIGDRFKIEKDEYILSGSGNDVCLVDLTTGINSNVVSVRDQKNIDDPTCIGAIFDIDEDDNDELEKIFKGRIPKGKK